VVFLNISFEIVQSVKNIKYASGSGVKENLLPHVFVQLYKQYCRPHLEFATPVWSPWNEADKQVQENVQKRQ
jgi:hypothetical protein